MYSSYMSVVCKCDNNLILKCLRELSDRKKYGNWLKVDGFDHTCVLISGASNCLPRHGEGTTQATMVLVQCS